MVVHIHVFTQPVIELNILSAKARVFICFSGYGSVLNLRGEVAMEASIMRGEDLNAGAVTLIKDFLHPISIAHKVLTDSPHVFLGGEGAKLFALEKVVN